MRRLIAAATLIASSFILLYAQQPDTQSLGPALRPATSQSPALGTPQDVMSRRLSELLLNLGQSQTGSSLTPVSGKPTVEFGPFVVLNGAVYTRLPGSQFLFPVSGGGASGCFSVDLPQRIIRLKEFIPRLEPLGKINAR